MRSDVFVPIEVDRDAAEEYPGECLIACFPRSVTLELLYYQFSANHKRLISGALIYDEFDELSDNDNYQFDIVYTHCSTPSLPGSTCEKGI